MLVYNVLAYSLGPSLLVLLPVFVFGLNWAWAAAALWIIINAVVGAKTRLYLRTREAVVNVFIAAGVSIALLAAVYAACWFVWPFVLGQHAIHPVEIVAPKPMMN